MSLSCLGALTLLLNGCGSQANNPPSNPVVEQAQIHVDSANLAFGQVTVGTTVTADVSLSNPGNTTLIISQVKVGDQSFLISTTDSLPVNIAPSAVYTFKVAFKPAAAGPYSSSLTIVSSATTSVVSLPVSGSGLNLSSPQISVSPANIAFASMTVGGNLVKTLDIKNTGTATLQIASLNISGAGFSIAGSSFPTSVEPNADLLLQVSFAPLIAGDATGQIAIDSNANAGAAVVVGLTGSGTTSLVSQLTISTSSIDFSQVNVGAASTQPLTMSSTGTGSLTVSSLAVLGGVFTVSGGQFPITLNPTQQVVLSVSFAPIVSGIAAGQIAIGSDSNSGATTTVALKGDGATPPPPVASPDPELTITPDLLSFGSVSLGSPVSKTVLVTSAGSSAVTINSLAISGAGFTTSGSNFPVTLNPYQQLALLVEFNPSAVGAGTGQVIIKSTARSNPVAVFSLSGTGVAVAKPQLSVSPLAINFGSVKLNATSIQTVTLSSTGTSPVTVSGASVVGGPAYSILGSSLPVTINPAQQVTLQVQFYPTAAGAAVGQITASNTGTTAGVVSLTGSGTANATAPIGTALSSCQAITKSGSYYLANDVTCTGQGFAINANNISLNLDGHTIYYGSMSSIVPAVSLCDTWFSGLPASSCGSGAHANLEIFNGAIKQTAGTKHFAHAIWIGQGNGIGAGSIHDLAITIQEAGTQAIFGDYPGAGWKIQNNVINDNVTFIEQPGQGPLSARANFQGDAIKFDNGVNSAGVGDTISGNTINGTPQGGIIDSNQNSQIYDNVIHMTTYYSNDYGVTVMADGENVHDNTVTGRGRGLDAESNNFILNHNTIDVHEEKNNSEYGGCELDGSDGIRVKNYGTTTTGWSVTDNTVKVESTDCQANGLRFTALLTPATHGTISGNTFTTIAGANPDYPLSFEGDNQAALTFTANTFTGTSVQVDWDGVNEVVQAGQIWHLTGITVQELDGVKTGSGDDGNFTQALTLDDSFANPAVTCGSFAGALVKVGSFSKQCGQ